MSIKDAILDPKNQNIWLGTHAGISLLKYNSISQKYQYVDQLVNKRTYALAVQNNQLLIGRIDGLYYLFTDSLMNYDFLFTGYKHDNFNYKINDLAIDSTNRVWIWTDGFGVYSCKDCLNETPQLIAETAGDIVQQLFVGDDNQIWCATSKGLKRIKIEDQNPVKTTIQTYNTSHGLPTPLINSVLVKDSVVYVATSEGITIMNSFLVKDTIAPRFYIANISINNTDTTILEKYHLSHQENNILIQFVGLSYKSHRQLTYQYRMKGIDENWRNTVLLEQEYPQLSSGTYAFQIQAIDINGIKSDLKTIIFVIQPPWWTSFLFIARIIILLFLMAYWIFKWRIKQLAKKQAEQLIIDKRFAELELQALQAQMNPHFIFNSLTAIQNFILKNNKLAADEYLVKFAKLMRAFLDASKEKNISLYDELELLKLYVNLEQLRFEGKFEVEWLIDDEVDTFSEMPSMILQPFVENAINHGLRYKETKGLLTIAANQKNDILRCTIRDNGVGRAKTQLIQSQGIKRHKSRGMSIIEERLKTLQTIEDLVVNIEITDLFDENQFPSGTQVDIFIQLEE